MAGVSNPGLVAALGPETTVGAAPGAGSLHTPGLDQPVPPILLDVILSVRLMVPR